MPQLTEMSHHWAQWHWCVPYHFGKSTSPSFLLSSFDSCHFLSLPNSFCLGMLTSLRFFHSFLPHLPQHFWYFYITYIAYVFSQVSKIHLSACKHYFPGPCQNIESCFMGWCSHNDKLFLSILMCPPLFDPVPWGSSPLYNFLSPIGTYYLKSEPVPQHLVKSPL